MKCETAEPDSEMHGNARIDCDMESTVNPNVADAGKLRSDHDIRASLAIINGYGQALNSSFQELKEQYNDLLEQNDGVSDTARGDRLMALEADCRFCLSRLCSSVAQLKESLTAGGVLRDSSQD